MTFRTIKSIGLIAVIAVVAVGAYAYSVAAPACDSDRTLSRATDVLRSQFNLESVFINNIQDVSGSIFSDRRECTAQITQIKGNIAPTAMTWRQLRYLIAPGIDPDVVDIKLDLGADEPYVTPPLTLWERIFGRNDD